MPYNLIFYRKENGEVPVLSFLESLPVKLRAKTFREIELLQEYGPELREPHTKPLKGKDNKGIYELRTRFSSDITRVFYCLVDGNTFILLHGFVKKSFKLSNKELVIARKNKKDYETRIINYEIMK